MATAYPAGSDPEAGTCKKLPEKHGTGEAEYIITKILKLFTQLAKDAQLISCSSQQQEILTILYILE